MSEIVKEASSGKTEQELEIDMLELCIVVCREYGDLKRIKKIEEELEVLKAALMTNQA